tara:strand:- start:16567 stop:17661 length:1095 start_codon:yes stop_codon:yes gene_type:complete
MKQENLDQLNPDNAEVFINYALKSSMLPNYFQTIKGVTNPNNTGANSNGMFDPFITNHNNEYQLNIGYSTINNFKTLEEAKVAKKDQLPISFNQVKQKVKQEYSAHEEEARSLINKKYGSNTFQKLPIKSQFVIQDYIRTGDMNDKFFDSVVKNDFKGAIENHQRPNLGVGNELFRQVMFSGPVGDNGFANIDQAKNYAKQSMARLNPEMSAEYSANVDANTSSFAGEEEQVSVMQEAQQSFDKGGMTNVQAEFTGNELVNNKESEMRAALSKGDKKKAAKIFRSQVKKKNITPGKADHASNPLPVAEHGTVMNKKGKSTGIKAKPGAGVYDHINKQYKSNMSDDEVIAMVQKNHAKWRKNGMD